MSQITALRHVLRTHLGWHGARLNFVALFLIALFRVKTVNLGELATAFVGVAQTDSSYKRLQRFFREFDLDYGAIAKAVITLMEIPQPWVLSLDRSEWQFGQTTFNILMLGVVHQGVAFPVVWVLLDKRGNSNTTERIDLVKRFLTLFPTCKIACLTADREFLGKDWFKYLLHSPRLPFRIRIRESDKLHDGRQELKARVVFQDLAIGESTVLGRRLWGCWVFVAGLRLPDGKFLIVATMDAPNAAITDYAARWGIETLFGIFKSRGFCLESTHLTDRERLSKLIALLTLALCWAHRIGEWIVERTPIKIKKHGRKAKSLFRTGFDHLRRILLNLESHTADYFKALKFLSCT